MSAKRLYRCPYCGDKNYTWFEKPSTLNRLAGCRGCGRSFRQKDCRDCPECGIAPPGHKILCKIGNAAAEKSQRAMEVRYRAARKKGLRL